MSEFDLFCFHWGGSKKEKSLTFREIYEKQQYLFYVM